MVLMGNYVSLLSKFIPVPLWSCRSFIISINFTCVILASSFSFSDPESARGVFDLMR